MTISEIDHINIRTDRLDETIELYTSRWNRVPMMKFASGLLALAIGLSSCGGPETDGATPESSTPTSAESAAPATDSPEEPEPSDSELAPQSEADCGGFFEQPYEVRKATVASDPATRTELEVGCVEQLARLDAAIDLQTRASAIDPRLDIPPKANSCQPNSGDQTFAMSRATNETDEVLGVIYGGWIVTGDRGVANTQPLLIRGIQPGEVFQMRVSLDEIERDPVSNLYNCDVRWSAFVDDTSDVDVATSAEASPQDDVFVWFPELIEQSRLFREADDPTVVERFEDIRAPGYESIVSDPTREIANPIVKVLPCEDSIVEDGEIMAFAYANELADGEQRISMGVFRQGSDGNWRWLTNAIFASEFANADCLAELAGS